MRWTAEILLLAAIWLGQTFAQGPASQAAATPVTTIRVTTRMVYVDVVVRDASGRCVHGLKQPDFKVAEDGKPQQVDFFSEHRYDLTEARAAAPAAKATPDLTFANVPDEGTGSGSVNMLLFDMVNTPLTDQVFARGQMLKFLKALPPGQQVALFVLTDRLHMIQSFTGSSDLLVAAADLLKAKPSELLRSQNEMMQTSDIYAKWEAAIGRSPSGESGSGNITTRWGKEDQLYDAVNADTRARITILAFAELAHATSGYSGRKNLLWLSGSFPTAVGAYLQLDNPGLSAPAQIGEIPGARETANLIASMQIAVYPINVSGVQTDFVGPQSSGDGQIKMMGPGGLDKTMQRNFNTRNVLRNNMDNIAHQTGGESFYSTNDLAGALRRGMEDGSNFYTVAYRPRNQKWNGAFRNIHVALEKKGYSLTYRRGYFAYADKPSSFDAQELLHRALQPGTPESTVLRLHARVTLPDAKHATTWVDSKIDPRTVEFSTDENGHHHAQLLVLLIALTDGATQPAEPPQVSGVVNLDLDQEAFAEALKRGIPVHQEVTLPAGKYRLRFGVCDVENRRMGTLDMPVSVGKTQAGISVVPRALAQEQLPQHFLQ